MRCLVLALISLPAFAWEVRHDSEGDVVTWTHPIVMTLDARAAELLHEPQAEAAIRAAAQNLDDATPGVSFTVVTGAPQDIGYQLDSTTNTNSVLVLEDWPYAEDALAVTLVTLNLRTNEILDADVAFNASSHQFRVLAADAANTDVSDDVQNTITHEFGHVLGLMHSAMEADLVMYPSAPPGEIAKRELKEDDRAGLLSLYPQGAAAATQPLDPAPAAGCSSAGLALFLAPLLLLLLRRPPPARVPVPVRRGRHPFLLLLLVLPTLARAADDADSEAVMEVTARTSAFHPLQKGLIFTTLTLETRACLKGPCAQRSTVVVPGGRVGELEQQIVDLPVPAEGQRLLISTRGEHRRIVRDPKSATTLLPLAPQAAAAHSSTTTR